MDMTDWRENDYRGELVFKQGTHNSYWVNKDTTDLFLPVYDLLLYVNLFVPCIKKRIFEVETSS